MPECGALPCLPFRGGLLTAARLVYALCVVLLTSSSVRAQSVSRPARGAEESPYSVEVLVSTQGGTVRLPGATITVEDSRGVRVASGVSDGEGRFRTPALGGG